MKHLVLTLAFAGSSLLPARAEILSDTQSISVSIAPLGRLMFPASLLLVNGGTAFTAYTGTLPFTYRVRTSSSGTGTITVQSNGDFNPLGGPRVEGGMLTYTCSTDGYGLPCSGTQVVSTSEQRPVIYLGLNSCTGGGGGCSTSDPIASSLSFSLQNTASSETGTYTVQLIFTVSCL